MSDHGITYLELTDSESRLMRETLESIADAAQRLPSGEERSDWCSLIWIYRQGIIRGTERLAREAVEKRKAKRT